MNKTGIEWTDYSWNPITGCLNGCPFCYARKLAEGRLRGRAGYPEVKPFDPMFHPDRIDEPKHVKEPSWIFAVSMGDMFSPGIKPKWINRVFDTIRSTPQHQY